VRIDAWNGHEVLKQLNDGARMTHKKDMMERKLCPFGANNDWLFNCYGMPGICPEAKIP
jgi:hypothetical protein